jgi:hypothetical protein
MELSNSSVGAAVMPQSKNWLQRVVGVFVSPESTMQDIAARPSWVLPLVILMLSGALSGFFLKEAIMQTQLEAMEKRNMTAEQMQQAQPMMEKWINIASVAMPIITTPLFYLLIAGLLMFTGNVILGGEAKFSQLFAVTCWSGMISVLGSIINVPIMANKVVMESATSLSSLLPSEENKSLLYHLFSQIDLFWLWWVAVIGFGVVAVYKFSTRKAMTTVFTMWVIYVVIAVAIKSIFS